MTYLTLLLAEVSFLLMDGRGGGGGGADFRFQKAVDIYSSNKWSLVGKTTRHLNETESVGRNPQSETTATAAAGARITSAVLTTSPWGADGQRTPLKSFRRDPSVPTTDAESVERKRGSEAEEEEEELQKGSTHAEMLENVQLLRRLAMRTLGARRRVSFGAGYTEPRSAGQDNAMHAAIRRSRVRRQIANLSGATGKTTSAPPVFTLPPPNATTIVAQRASLLQANSTRSTANGTASVVRNVSRSIVNASLAKAPNVPPSNASGVGSAPSANRTKTGPTTVVGLNVSSEPSDVTGAAANVTGHVSDNQKTETEASSSDTTASPPALDAAETKAAVQEVRAEIIIKNSTLPKKARKKMAKLQLVIVCLMAVLLVVLISLTVCLVFNKERLVTVKKVEAPKGGEKQPLIGSAPTPAALGAGQETGHSASKSRLVPFSSAPQNKPSPGPVPGPAPASPSPHRPPMMPTPSPALDAVPSSAQLPSAVPSSASFAQGP